MEKIMMNYRVLFFFFRGHEAWGEGDDRGQDGWMTSLTQWTWVWASSRKWGRTGKPGVLHSLESQSLGHDWMTEKNNKIILSLVKDVPYWKVKEQAKDISDNDRFSKVISKLRTIFLWWLLVLLEEDWILFQKWADNVNINREANWWLSQIIALIINYILLCMMQWGYSFVSQIIMRSSINQNFRKQGF